MADDAALGRRAVRHARYSTRGGRIGQGNNIDVTSETVGVQANGLRDGYACGDPCEESRRAVITLD